MRQPSSGLARANHARDPRQNVKSLERNTPPPWWLAGLGWAVGGGGLVGGLAGWWLGGEERLVSISCRRFHEYRIS